MYVSPHVASYRTCCTCTVVFVYTIAKYERIAILLWDWRRSITYCSSLLRIPSQLAQTDGFRQKIELIIELDDDSDWSDGEEDNTHFVTAARLETEVRSWYSNFHSCCSSNISDVLILCANG